MRCLALALALAVLPVATPGHAAPPPANAASSSTTTTRTRDAAPWIAGIPLSRATTPRRAVWACTTGIPARRGARSFILIAGHCGRRGERIYTAWSGSRRTLIGRVSATSQLIDVAAVQTSGAVRAAYRTTAGLHRLRGVAASRRGQRVCHNGATSRTVCGITVVGSRSRRGVVTTVYGHTPKVAGRGGDSGGLVYDRAGRAVGIVSSISRDRHWISWTPAKTALGTWNLTAAR